MAQNKVCVTVDFHTTEDNVLKLKQHVAAMVRTMNDPSYRSFAFVPPIKDYDIEVYQAGNDNSAAALQNWELR